MGGLPVKPKVQGYIAQEVFDKFQEYCKSNKLSQSAGLEVVIAEFFGIKREVMEEDEKITYIETFNILTSEVENLNGRISELERWRLDLEDISTHISNANLACLLANPVANLDGTVADTSTGIADISANLNTDIVGRINPLPLVIAISDPLVPPNLPPHNQMQLARRWGMIGKTGRPDNSQISKKKSQPNFTEWSRDKDPEGIGWCYREPEKLFYPVM